MDDDTARRDETAGAPTLDDDAQRDDEALASLDSVLVTASLVLGRPLTIVPRNGAGQLAVLDELSGFTVFATPADDPLAVAELELQLSDLAGGRARFLYTDTGAPYIAVVGERDPK